MRAIARARCPNSRRLRGIQPTATRAITCWWIGGLALNCVNQPDQALAKFREAAALEPTAHVYTQMAKVYGDRGQWTEFDDALNRAQAIDPSFASIYAYRGIEYVKLKRWADAVREYQHALQLDPSLEPTIQPGLIAARQQLARQPVLQPAGGR